MKYDQEKVDLMALALLYLTTSRDKFGARAWKGWDVTLLDRLFEKGYIQDLGNKSPTLLLTPEGAKLSEELFREHFCQE